MSPWLNSPGGTAVSAPALPEPVLPESVAGRSARWADLRLRIASALVLAPLAILCVWLGGWPWYALVAAALAGVCWELAKLCRGHALALAAGFGYAGLATACLVVLRADPAQGRIALLFLLVVVWASDIGAYVVGRLIGGRRLAPTISPGKTWSGAVGGLLAAVLGGQAVAGFSAHWAYDPVRVAAVAAVLGVASQLGDLFESAVKRHFGVKDAGRLIPGHGGLLDRLDGLMAAALVAGGWALATGQGSAIWQ